MQDGEVTCKSCANTRLNRTDLNCWRCGSRALERSALTNERPGMVALQTYQPGDKFVVGMTPTGAPLDFHYWVSKDRVGTINERAACVCPECAIKLPLEVEGAGRLLIPEQEGYTCVKCADKFVAGGRWTK